MKDLCRLAQVGWLGAVVLVIVGGLLASSDTGDSDSKSGASLPSPSTRAALLDARVFVTGHYTIHSTATEAQTAQVSTAVEALYAAYADVFGVQQPNRRFQLVLYKDREEFRARSSNKAWAEAYYRPPRCYAYFSDAENPNHWMIHEAAHQLMWELSGFRSWKWVKEGVACYFGTSTLSGTTLLTGVIDPATYPIWWLPTFPATGDLQADIRAGRIIPLRQLILGKGPDMDTHFNLYYIHYWSLSHFLFRYDNGRHAAKFRELIGRGGSPDDFERLIGPIEQIEREWYAYLLQQVKAAAEAKLPAAEAKLPAAEAKLPAAEAAMPGQQ